MMISLNKMPLSCINIAIFNCMFANVYIIPMSEVFRGCEADLRSVKLKFELYDADL